MKVPRKKRSTNLDDSGRFDSAYYRRFYVTVATRAVTRAETDQRGRLVAAAVQQLDLPVRRILDAGCGLGWFRKSLLRAFPQAQYVGVEYSEYLCRRFGWIQGSIANFRSRHTFELMICSDVLQYLDDRAAAQAIGNLARLSRGALYLHVPTELDFKERADLKGTDMDVQLRSGDWYREKLDRHFEHAGFGVYVKRGVPVTQWELESGT
jgi:trans-aconitate methyltransferase